MQVSVPSRGIRVINHSIRVSDHRGKKVSVPSRGIRVINGVEQMRKARSYAEFPSPLGE